MRCHYRLVPGCGACHLQSHEMNASKQVLLETKQIRLFLLQLNLRLRFLYLALRKTRSEVPRASPRGFGTVSS